MKAKLVVAIAAAAAAFVGSGPVSAMTRGEYFEKCVGVSDKSYDGMSKCCKDAGGTFSTRYDSEGNPYYVCTTKNEEMPPDAIRGGGAYTGPTSGTYTQPSPTPTPTTWTYSSGAYARR